MQAACNAPQRCGAAAPGPGRCFTASVPVPRQALRLARHGRPAGPGCGPVAARASISYREQLSQGPDIAVEVFGGEQAVGARMCELVAQAAAAAIADHGSFFLAIPGGSVLKMCAGLVGRGIQWDKTHLFYVNHKCVPLGDSASTHAKARSLFLTRVGLPEAQVATLMGTGDAVAEARAYEAKLRQVASQAGMEMTPSAVPCFDLVLLGMGADGHVGSLYPGRPETTMAAPGTPLVLPVAKKQPASITLSLPVMCAAKQVIVAMTGGNKADAVWGALQGSGAADELPARLVRPAAGCRSVWLMDAPAASKLQVAWGARSLVAADVAARALVAGTQD